MKKQETCDNAITRKQTRKNSPQAGVLYVKTSADMAMQCLTKESNLFK